MRKSILVVDDELSCECWQDMFQTLGYNVVSLDNSSEAIDRASNEDFDLIVTDIMMPRFNGAQVVQKIREAKPAARILVRTAFPNDPLALKALEAGAIGIVEKPFEVAKILDYL